MCYWNQTDSDSGGDDWRKHEEARQARIRQGEQNIDQVFSQFDDGFYDDRRQALIDYEAPQLEEQYKTALGDLVAALSRSGMGKSSVSADRKAKAQRDKDFQGQEMRDRGDQTALNAKNAVNAARNTLSTGNIALADPTRATNSAMSNAEALTALPKYEPLLRMFGDLSEGLATQSDLERRQKARYQSGLFSTPSSARTVG